MITNGPVCMCERVTGRVQHGRVPIPCVVVYYEAIKQEPKESLESLLLIDKGELYRRLIFSKSSSVRWKKRPKKGEEKRKKYLGPTGRKTCHKMSINAEDSERGRSPRRRDLRGERERPVNIWQTEDLFVRLYHVLISFKNRTKTKKGNIY